MAERFGIESMLAIRTRLTSVKGFRQLVGRSLQQEPVDVDIERLTRHTDRLIIEIDDLERLLLQFLTAFQLHDAHCRPQWHAVDLIPLMHNITASVATLTQQDGAPRLQIHGPPSVPGIWDKTWLTDALSAVITNALAYSPKGSTIDIRIRRDDGYAEVTVQDSGPGIQPDERFTIFQPFVRGSAASLYPAGWGLGLFVASEVVAQHGGQIEVESAPGAGSAFTLRLPTMPPRAADA